MKLLNFQILLEKFTLGIYIKKLVEVIKEITYKFIFVFASFAELLPVISHHPYLPSTVPFEPLDL